MSGGRFIAVVGPSGVGKDSVMDGLTAVEARFQLVKRTITRAPELGGEDYDAVTLPVFEEMVDEGAFCLHWGAHGLHYGIPVSAQHAVENGAECLANLSRSVLGRAAEVFERFTVLNIGASPEVLAARLVARGRESASDIAQRLSKANRPLPADLNVINIVNDSTLEAAVTKAQSALCEVKV